MSGDLCVIRSEPRQPPPGAVSEHPGAGAATGFAAFEQSVLWLGPHSVAGRATGEAEETLFVLAGAGVLHDGASRLWLEPETGAYLPPDHHYELAAGPDGMQVVCVRIPDAQPGHGAPRTSRLSEQPVQSATTEREFRIVADPSTGLRSATHFVGYIPSARAPEHFHLYDEVIYVVEGKGVFHAHGTGRPVGPGTCIGLPARLVHCLENTGGSTMRVQAVFRPAGSPAAAYYPDGTPAYPGAPAQI